MSEDLLTASIRAAGSGPVIVLSGDADLASAGRLRELIDGQLAGGVRLLTIDVSGLRYADSASVRELLLAARTLHERDGHLMLLSPQSPVARLLELNGADQLMIISTTSTSVP